MRADFRERARAAAASNYGPGMEVGGSWASWLGRALIALVAGGLVASCSEREPGSPHSRPPVPADVAFAGVNPCELVSTPVRRTLDLAGGVEASDVVVRGGRQCDWRSPAGDRRFSVTTLPPRYTLDSILGVYDQREQVTVAGRPAVQTHFYAADVECILFVEIAEDRLLDVHFASTDLTGAATHESSCAEANRFAIPVVDALLAR